MSEQAATAGAVPATEAVTPAPAVRTGAASWSVALLATAAFLAAVDRQAMANLLVPIQKDLHVSDAAMGGLTGSAFALMYAFVAIPLAMLADRMNRKNLMAVAIALWSGAAFVGGLARTYMLLLLARIGVGGGEAAVLPAAMSTIGDLAPPESRGTPIGFYSAGGALGFASGGLIAGLVNDKFGWHIAIMAVAVPGLLLAATMFLTMREPVRGAHDGAAAGAPRELLLQGLKRCARITTFYPFAIGYVFLQICYTGWLVWMPAFLMRAHHLSATQAGLVMLAVTGGGMCSTLAAGPISDRLAKRGPRWRMLFAGITSAVSVPLLAISSLTTGMPITFAFLIAYTLVGGSLTALSQTTYLSMAPVSMRGLVTALMNIMAMGVGGGLAPIIYGGVNDVLKRTYGDQSLHYTLLIPPAAMVVTCVMYLLASRTMDRDVRNVSAA